MAKWEVMKLISRCVEMEISGEDCGLQEWPRVYQLRQRLGLVVGHRDAHGSVAFLRK